MQIKQERAIAESELSYARNELFVTRFSAGLASDSYLSAYAKLYATHDWPTGGLAETEIAAAEIDAMLWWAYLETTYWHRQQGLVDDAEWSSWDRNVRWSTRELSPVYRAVFQKFWLPTPSEFTRAVERIQSASSSNEHRETVR